jgi:molecular chaperone DnaK (HSP70)
MMHACNFSTQKPEHQEFKASFGYLVRIYIKKKKKERKKEKERKTNWQALSMAQVAWQKAMSSNSSTTKKIQIGKYVCSSYHIQVANLPPL